MKVGRIVSVLPLLCSLSAVRAANLSPISRCVELLKNLGKQIERESKEEEKMFEEYMCWGKTSVDAKTASTSAAESRIDMLTQYLADIAAGRVEFSSERQDLEKEIEELTADLELAKGMRGQEKKDFEVAEDEMKQAVAALKSAVEVLDKATKDHKGSLLSMKTVVNEGFAARAAEGASLNRAVELGKKFLTKGDAYFLQRLLTGEVPTADWKKLNRKAAFKNKYKARSGKIQDVLKNLQATFQRNLDEATSKENAAQATYDKLKGNKQGQLDKATESLSKMEKEMGARGMSKADSEQEVADLKDQVKNDNQFIADTQKAMDTKTKEWKARSELRAGELRAISEAIAILASDDAKDNFKKSMASQGFFLQTSQSSTLVNRARQQIQKLADTTNDTRLFALIGSMTGGHFDEVIKSIDKMIATLRSEEQKDLTTKQDCEKDRMGDTRDALEAGRAIDDMTDSITALTAEIKDLKKELATTNAELEAARKEMAEATKIRKAEAAEWKESDADDAQASETVADAMEVLEKFYRDNFGAFVQKQQTGQAPPPPPPTWEGEYKGKMGETGGIMGILKICKEDIDKDRSSAKKSEDEAQSAYDKIEKAFKEQEKTLLKSIGELEGQIGEKGTKVEDTKKSRVTKKGELDATMTKIKNADPGCNYIAVNYPVRLKNRQIEVDGLLKAKAILQGAAFATPADEDRDIKPGDALLQRVRRH